MPTSGSAHAVFVESLRARPIGGRYIVEDLLAHGGMGLVVSARNPELDQRVAVKLLLPELAASTVLSARFLREARLAAQVESPHLVRVFDVGRLESGVPYMVMELLAGTDLAKALAERGALPVTDAVDIVLQAIAGIAHIHASGIVHRDLKPSNVFLSRGRGGTMTVKILDFGISKQSSQEAGPGLTATDTMLGTPQYMSPEQINEARSVDARSDVWSLGVILYESLVNKLPFIPTGDTAGALFGAILYTDPVPIDSLRPELPPDLARAIMRCLERSADARFTTVADLAAALIPFAGPTTANRLDEIRRTLLSLRPPRPSEVGADDVIDLPSHSAGLDAASVADTSTCHPATVALGFGASLRSKEEPGPEPASTVRPPPALESARPSRAIGPALVAVAIVGLVTVTLWLTFADEPPHGSQVARATSLAVTSLTTPSLASAPSDPPPHPLTSESAPSAPSASAIASVIATRTPPVRLTRPPVSAAPPVKAAPSATTAPAPSATVPIARDRGI